MAMHFVSTSILSSADGIGFDKEEIRESEETRAARVAAERAASKPLFEQLAAQQEKKQEEYDAQTKLIFAPPKALDDEDVEYFEHMAEIKKKQQNQLHEQEEIELAAFRSAKNTSHPPAKPLNLTKHDEKKKATVAPKIVVKSKKRKVLAGEEGERSGPETGKAARKERNIIVANRKDKMDEPAPVSASVSGDAMSLLGGYESDSS